MIEQHHVAIGMANFVVGGVGTDAQRLISLVQVVGATAVAAEDVVCISLTDGQQLGYLS